MINYKLNKIKKVNYGLNKIKCKRVRYKKNIIWKGTNPNYMVQSHNDYIFYDGNLQDNSYQDYQFDSRINRFVGYDLDDIPDYAFWCCTNLTEIELYNIYGDIGFSAFYNTGILQFNQSLNGHNIGSNAFAECLSLEDVSLINVKEVKNSAFSNCRSLKKLEIGSTVTALMAYSFENCNSLDEITCTALNPIITEVTFKNISDIGTLYLIEGANASNWRKYLPSGWNIEYI